jgi:hypothetical protein
MTRYGWALTALGLMGLVAFGMHAAFSSVLLVEWEVVGAAGAVLVALGITLDRESLLRWAAERGARATAVSSLSLLTALGAVIALNVVAQRYDKRLDLTGSGRFTLSEQTVKVVGDLSEDIEVHAFFTTGSPEDAKFRDLVEGYAPLGSRLRFTFHDPMMEPTAAQQFKVTSAYGTVVLVAAGEGPAEGRKQQRLESNFDEEALTNAIVRLTSGKDHTICVSSGHEELDPDDEQQAAGMGISVLKLEGQNYTFKPVVLLREGGVPSDCEVFIVADPQVDWLAPEREMLAAWIASGGDAIVLLDPGHAQGLATDMARYNIAVGDDFILEQNPNYQLENGDLSHIILDRASFDFHPVTNPLKGGLILRVARSVSILDPEASGLKAQELARTTMNSWAEADYMDAAKVGYQEGRDRLGPVSLAVIVEVEDPSVIPVGSRALSAAPTERAPLPVEAPPSAPTPAPDPGDPALGEVLRAPERAPVAPPTLKAGAKLVVIGDSDFLSNELVDNFSNQDLLPNLLAWMVGEEAQIAIRPTAGGGGTFTLTLVQKLMIGLLSLLVVPGLAIMGALQTWRSRRSR